MNITSLSICRYRKNKNRGSLLILSLWAISLLSFFAVYIGMTARQRISLAEKLNRRQELREIAEAGVKRGWTELRKTDSDVSTDSFKEPWAVKDGLWKESSIMGGFFHYKIVDEESKININTASEDVLKRLFKMVLLWSDAQSEELAASIIDWRDSDDSSLPEGAENDYYSRLKYSYECKNASMNFLDELLLVRGVTATIYSVLREYITVYGSGVVNINTASQTVLQALGLDEKTAVMVLQYRRADDEIDGTKDDRIFTDASSIVSKVSMALSLNPSDLVSLSSLAASGLAGVSSENFSIISEAYYADISRGKISVTAIFHRTPLDEAITGYKVEPLYWHIN